MTGGEIMLKTGVKKAINRRESHTEGMTVDPTTMEPSYLHEWFLKALADLSRDEWAAMRDKVLKSLGEAGVKLGACVLVLGIPARRPEELTPPELAMLVRYVRMNAPEALKPISEQLMQLRHTQREPLAVPGRKAA
jgi:hypothetical protein